MKASGYDEATQQKLTSFEIGALKTSISRDVPDPSLVWVDKPTTKSRSQLRAERRAENVATLEAAKDRNEADGILGAEGRVQQRIDRNIAFLQAAPQGKSREALLASRRAERADAAYSAYAAYQPQKPPTFSAQPEPFWKLPRPAAPKGSYVTTSEFASTNAFVAGSALNPNDPFAPVNTTAEAIAAVSAPAAADDDLAPSAAPAASASSPDLLPNGSRSQEMFRAKQRWWAKPDVYPKVAPAEPRAEEPFKLSMREQRYLERKLSSGARKSQRGYSAETRQVSDKITTLPPPSLAHFTDAANERKPFQAYTGATFKFMPAEPREVVQGQDQTAFDGYEFTQPLYSSFTADRTFQPMKLPPRPAARPNKGGVAVRERARPSTGQGGGQQRGGPSPSSAPNGPGNGGMLLMDASMRPGTAALGSIRG